MVEDKSMGDSVPEGKLTMEKHFLLQIERISQAACIGDIENYMNGIEVFNMDLLPYRDEQFKEDLKNLDKWREDSELALRGQCQNAYGDIDEGLFESKRDFITRQYYHQLYGLLNGLLPRSGWVESSVHYVEFNLTSELKSKLCAACKGVVSPAENPFRKED